MLSVVLPARNEAQSLDRVLEQLAASLKPCNVSYELVVVDDGSRDGTFEKIASLRAKHPTLKGIRFSRNFGKEAAILAGLRAAKGSAMVTMDADLQHPPELIPEMLNKWREGARVVHAIKQERPCDNFITRWRAAFFNGLLTRLGGINMRDASDFKLLDRAVVDVIVLRLLERNRFYRGLAGWVGFNQVSIPFAVNARNAGESKGSWASLLDLASSALVSFSSAPLRIITLLGFITLVFGSVVSADALWSWWRGHSVSGFATIILTLLMLGSFIMISLGIIGEYIAKIYEELKARPPYIVESICGFGDYSQIGQMTHPNTGSLDILS